MCAARARLHRAERPDGGVSFGWRLRRTLRPRWDLVPELRPPGHPARSAAPDDSGGWLSAGGQRFNGWIVRERTELGIITAVWYLGFGLPPLPPGRPKERLTDRGAILDAVIGTQEEVHLGHVDSWEEWLEIKKMLPPPISLEEAHRELKEHRREHVGRAVALGLVNVEETHRVYGGVKRWRTLYEWAQRPSVLAWVEKTGKNSSIGEQVDMPKPLEEIDARLEVAQSEIEAARADLRRLVAEGLEPDDPRVRAAVDRFLGDALSDAD